MSSRLYNIAAGIPFERPQGDRAVHAGTSEEPVSRRPTAATLDVGRDPAHVRAVQAVAEDLASVMAKLLAATAAADRTARGLWVHPVVAYAVGPRQTTGRWRREDRIHGGER